MWVSVRDNMPHSLCNNVTLTLTSKVVLILANCPTAAGYSAYGGRCLKVYPDNVNYDTAKGRCSADGGHLYHYKSLAFDREPVRLLLESSGGYSNCHRRFSLLLIIAQFQSLVSTKIINICINNLWSAAAPCVVVVLLFFFFFFYSRRTELLSKIYHETDCTKDHAVRILVA